jgi:hypothetical protein
MKLDPAEWYKRIKAFAFRKRYYQVCFGTPAGQFVLEDLLPFCRATESCYHDDPRLHAVLEGRREVWLRIQNYMGLTPEQLMVLYSKPTDTMDLSQEQENA